MTRVRLRGGYRGALKSAGRRHNLGESLVVKGEDRGRTGI